MDPYIKFSQVFAEAVRKRRAERGITQAELAVTLKRRGVRVSQGYISLLEAGQRRDPSLKLVLALSDILGISIDEAQLNSRDENYEAPNGQR